MAWSMLTGEQPIWQVCVNDDPVSAMCLSPGKMNVVIG
jgi:hypothetical protein